MTLANAGTWDTFAYRETTPRGYAIWGHKFKRNRVETGGVARQSPPRNTERTWNERLVGGGASDRQSELGNPEAATMKRAAFAWLILVQVLASAGGAASNTDFFDAVRAGDLQKATILLQADPKLGGEGSRIVCRLNDLRRMAGRIWKRGRSSAARRSSATLFL